MRLGARKHLLMPQAVRRSLPRLYETDGLGMGAVARAKYFSPWSAWTLYVTEFDGEDTLYGYCVNGSVREWGYSSLAEMERTEFRGMPGIERDKWFSPLSVGQAVAEQA